MSSLQLKKKKITAFDAKKSEDMAYKEMTNINAGWKCMPVGLNALTLDRFELSMDEGATWDSPEFILNIQEKLVNEKKEGMVYLKTKFLLEDQSVKSIYLNLELSEQYEILINGRNTGNTGEGWWIDRNIRKIGIEDFIHSGENEIILKRFFKAPCTDKSLFEKDDISGNEMNRFAYDVEFENIYITGSFKVIHTGKTAYENRDSIRLSDGEFRLTELTDIRLDNGLELTGKGFWFYPGNMRLERKIEIHGIQPESRYYIEIGRIWATNVNLYVNGRLAGHIPWRPYRIDITGYLIDGQNEITIELCNNCRNLLGPHHHYRGELYFVGPNSYIGKKAWEDHEYPETPEDTSTDAYSFVKFGIKDIYLVREQYASKEQERFVDDIKV